MYYGDIRELPKQVKDLPKEAQEIYLKAFNEYYQEFSKLEPRDHDSLILDEKANRGAWAAVKLKFKKQKNGKWVPK